MFAELSLLSNLTVAVIPLLFAITLHEVAHGYVANCLGDPTARRAGRLTLNPMNHVDLVGTLVVPALLLTFGGVLFGWAKPVPVNWYNLRRPRRDVALVALAGPAANLCMAIFWAFTLKFASYLPSEATQMFLFYSSGFGITINIVLLVLNLLPIPPLDGSRVLRSLLPPRLATYIDVIEPYGFIILIILLLLQLLPTLINPPFLALRAMILTVVGISA